MLEYTHAVRGEMFQGERFWDTSDEIALHGSITARQWLPHQQFLRKQYSEDPARSSKI